MRESLRFLGIAQQQGGIVLDPALLDQKPVEGPQRRDLARERRRTAIGTARCGRIISTLVLRRAGSQGFLMVTIARVVTVERSSVFYIKCRRGREIITGESISPSTGSNGPIVAVRAMSTLGRLLPFVIVSVQRPLLSVKQAFGLIFQQSKSERPLCRKRTFNQSK